MDALFSPLAASLGASPDQLKLISCLLVSYPLGSVFIRVPGATLKHVFTIAVALFYFIPMLNLQFGVMQLLADVLATYYVAKYVRGPQMPWIVFWINMGHLTVNHVIRVVFGIGYETFEITGPQMVLVMKLTTFAWNVQDGRRSAEDLDKWQTAMKVSKYPSLLEFVGYAFYFPGVLVGPYLEYAAYASLVDGTLFKTGDAPDKPRRRAIPDGRKRVAYKRSLVGIFFLLVYVLLGSTVNSSALVTDWFAQQGLLYRIAFAQLALFIERSKYYGIWTLTEGAAILTGFGFTGFLPDGTSRWEGAANINVQRVELAPNFKVLLDSWNMKTNIWLRECIYKRVTPKGKKPGFRSSMLTFATSAFWHGIAPGYYLTFLLGGFVQTCGRLCRGYLRPLLLPVTPAPTIQSTASNGVPNRDKPTLPEVPPSNAKKAYDVAGTIATQLILNFAAAPFCLLTMRDSLEAWRRLDWYGLWMVGGCLTFFYAGGRSWLKGLQAQRIRAATGVAVPPEEIRSGLERGQPGVVPPMDSIVHQIEKKL